MAWDIAKSSFTVGLTFYIVEIHKKMLSVRKLKSKILFLSHGTFNMAHCIKMRVKDPNFFKTGNSDITCHAFIKRFKYLRSTENVFNEIC